MSTTIQVKRGTEAQCDAVTPASGEPLWDTENKQLRVGDGSTAGGIKTKMEILRWREIVGTVFAGAGVDTVAPTSNLSGGHRLDNVADLLYYSFHMRDDWIGTEDPVIRVIFELPNDNSGGGAGDTVDLQLVLYYKGEGDIVNKTQTLEVATVVGQAAQYTQFRAEFVIDHDLGGNILEPDDELTMILNLETDTSEVDDIIVNYLGLRYRTLGLLEA